MMVQVVLAARVAVAEVNNNCAVVVPELEKVPVNVVVPHEF